MKLQYQDWLTLGECLFGEDLMRWEFVCPSCGNIQTPKDLEEAGAEPEEALFNCIGRYIAPQNDMCSGKKPCNYSLGGLIRLDTGMVVISNGKEHRVFAFSRSL